MYPLTIRQIYIRLADGLSAHELGQAAQLSSGQLLQLSQDGALAQRPWSIDYALGIFLRWRFRWAADYLQNQVLAALDQDSTVAENAARFDSSPIPLIALVAGACQPFDARRTRKAIIASAVHEATLVDVARIGLDFFTRLEVLIAQRSERTQRATVGTTAAATDNAKPKE